MWLGARKEGTMKKITAMVLGLVLLLGMMQVSCFADSGEKLPVSLLNEGKFSVSLSIERMTGQSELMKADCVSGKVTVSNQSGGAVSAVVMLAAYQNNKMIRSQVLHKGEILSGIMPFSFSLDKITRADALKAFVFSDSMEPFCFSAGDGLEPAQVILFKFDDARPTVMGQTAQFDQALSYLAEQGIPATAGVLGKWLEDAKNNPSKYEAQIGLVRKWILEGHQLWIHGYDHAQGEFAALGEAPAASYEKQKETIQTTYDLMESVLHYSATCFAASYNQNNEDTISVLNQEFPQISTVLFTNDPNGRLEAMNLTNSCTMEIQTGVVSYEAFLNHYEMVKDKPYLVLQAHPGYWEESSLEGLKQIVAYLQQQNCVFMTPEQYRLFSSAQK